MATVESKSGIECALKGSTPVVEGHTRCSLRFRVALGIGVGIGVFVCAGIAAKVMLLDNHSNHSLALPCPSSHTFKVADAVNAKYALNETGVLMHFHDQTENKDSPWKACMDDSNGCGGAQVNTNYTTHNRLSFLVLNHLAWNGSQVSLFLGAAGLFGYIGTEHVTADLTTCLFPKDGYTDFRTNEGCGCGVGTAHQTCHQANTSNWCDGNEPNVSAPSYSCAYHPNQLPEMMKQWSNNLAEQCYGRGADSVYCYNEAVVDGAKWNNNVDMNLQAFLLPVGSKTQCGPDTDCYREFAQMYRSYTQVHGDKPILGIDVTMKEKPFHAFVPHDQTCENTHTAYSLLMT